MLANSVADAILAARNNQLPPKVLVEALERAKATSLSEKDCGDPVTNAMYSTVRITYGPELIDSAITSPINTSLTNKLYLACP